MIDAWPWLEIGEFEHVAVGPSVMLLRVSGRSSGRPNPERRPELVADHGSGQERYAALPSPPDPPGVLRAAYSVPAAVVGAEARFWLDLGGESTVELPAPTLGTARRAAEGDQAAATDAAAAAEGVAPAGVEDHGPLTTTLAQARARAEHLQAENEQLTAALQELEIWRGELERRLADTTTELADARSRLAGAHAAAEREALIARAEADALEQAARELVEAAGQGRSAG